MRRVEGAVTLDARGDLSVIPARRVIEKISYLPVLFTAAGIPGAAGRMFWMFSSNQ